MGGGIGVGGGSGVGVGVGSMPSIPVSPTTDVVGIGEKHEEEAVARKTEEEKKKSRMEALKNRIKS